MLFNVCFSVLAWLEQQILRQDCATLPFLYSTGFQKCRGTSDVNKECKNQHYYVYIETNNIKIHTYMEGLINHVHSQGIDQLRAIVKPQLTVK